MSETTYEQYIDDIKNAINSKLSEYIAIEGIHVGNNNAFRCPNTHGHARGDENPSASLNTKSSRPYWHCFVCEAGSDTIALATYRENLPTSGPGFMDTTIPTLCKKLGIKYDPESVMSEAQKEIRTLYRANEILSHAATANLVTMMQNNTNHPAVAFMQERGYTISDANKYDMGSLDIQTAISLLNRSHIPTKLQHELGIIQTSNTGRYIFSDNSVIFAIRGDHGHILGFAARNLLYGTPGHRGAKYINSANNSIFKKGEILYGLNEAKNYIDTNNGHLYIFEGYTDRITASKYGLPNTVAIGGTALQKEQLDLIGKYSTSKVLIALDGDKAGIDAMQKIENEFSSHRDISLYFMEMPSGDDPDSLIRRDNTLRLFNSIQKYSLIEYKVKYTFEKAQTNQMANIESELEVFFEWLVSIETNHIKRLKCIPLLAMYTNLLESDLKKQLEYQAKLKSDDTAKKVDTIWYDTFRNSRVSTLTLKDRITLLDQARNSLIEIMPAEDKNIITDQTSELDRLRHEFETNTITPIKFGWKETLDKHVMIPKAASVAMIGAYPNVGKSILMRCMGLGAVMNNPDMGVIYFSMDDPKSQTIPAMVAKLGQVKINDIRYPRQVRPEVMQETKNRINTGYSQLKEFMLQSRIAIFDQSDVLTIGDIETTIEICIEKMSKQKLKPLVIIDSLHSVIDPGTGQIRENVMSHIRSVKRMSNIYDIPIAGVVELRKGNAPKRAFGSPGATNNMAKNKPSLRDIAETVDIEYRVTVGMVIYNDLQAMRENANTYWVCPKVDNKAPLPVIELILEKNKEGYYKGDIWLKSNPYYSDLIEIEEKSHCQYRHDTLAGDLVIEQPAANEVVGRPISSHMLNPA